MSNFRLNAKKVFATWSQSGEWELDELYKFINDKYPLEKALLAKEHHQDGNLHFHAALEFKKKVDIRNSRVFDYKNIHPSLEPMRNWDGAMIYLTKEESKQYGNWESEAVGDNPYSMLRQKEFSREEFMGDCCKRKIPFAYAIDAWRNYENTSNTTFDEDPNLPIPHALLKILSLPTITNPNTSPPPVGGDEASGPKEPPTGGSQQSLVLMGPSGIGKTNWALKHAPKPTLLVSHVDDLKKLSKRHKSIIFDDVDFTHWPVTSQIHITDCAVPRTIHVRYGTVTIPNGIVKIFTCNNACLSWNNQAIRRRINLIELY